MSRFNTKKLIILLAVTELVLASLLNILMIRSSVEVREYKFKSSLIIVNRGKRAFNPNDIELNVINLFPNTSWQRSYLMYVLVNNAPTKWQISFDIDTNPVIRLELPLLPLNSSLSIVYEETVYEIHPKTIDSPFNTSLGDFLAENGPWQLNDEILRSLAYNLSRGSNNDFEILISFIDWIDGHVKYGGKMPPRYPNEVLKEGSGDCDEQAMLLITLCRIARIPALMQIGCIYMPNTHQLDSIYNNHVKIELVNIGWHAWSLVYLSNRGWVPVDMTYYLRRSHTALDHINGAAFWQRGTLSLAYISNYDYVKDARKLKDVLERYNIQLIEKDELYLMKSRFLLRWDLILLSLIIIIIVILALIIFLLLKEHKK